MTEKYPTATVTEDGSVNIDGDPIAATRGDLKSALKSVDNLTALLTMLCKDQERRALVIEAMFLSNDQGGGMRIYITADNTLDETELAKVVLSGMEEMLKGALNKETP